MTYQEFRKKQQTDISNFPMFFAFSDKQLKEGLEKLGNPPTSEMVSIGAGGFMLKKDKPNFDAMFKRHETELNENMKNPDFAYSAFDYELANHEYCITCDNTDALETLNLTYDDVLKNPVLFDALNKAQQNNLETSW